MAAAAPSPCGDSKVIYIVVAYVSMSIVHCGATRAMVAYTRGVPR